VEAVVGDSTPFCSSQPNTSATELQLALHRIGAAGNS
jgi:hypothetical protein